ncbi:MAG: acyl-[acyl-carrier-protein]-phospholipid O-acyltransferase [Chlamydiales bacterium]|jgi:acyl-[acyl-carrier-protein]-phospholipid O-acyltransferase/long-chain-fatty-acid--[acyl-carrier-protein] ligase
MFKLLQNRSFAALTATQFLGAFNDNAFKQLVLMLAVAAAAGSGPEWVSGSSWAVGQALPATLFALPFVLFGALTGACADRFSKSRIIKFANLLEVAVMGLALLAFQLRSFEMLLCVVFLMGTQSAIFGPSKYGAIHEIVGRRNLSPANALIQMSTMVAVLGGVMLGGIFLQRFGDRLWIPGLSYVGLALIGWWLSLSVSPLAAADPARRLTWNGAAELRRHWRIAAGNSTLMLSIVASGFFYLVAATLLLVVNKYGAWLGLEPEPTAMLNGMTVVGIAIGSLTAGRLSGERIEGGLVPLGLFGLGASLFVVALDPHSAGLLRATLVAAGFFAGLFSIPIRALIQGLPKDGQRGSILGLSEMVDFIGILLASGAFALMSNGLALEPAQMFYVIGGTCLLFTAVSLLSTAEFAVRLGLLLFVRTFYKLRTRGLEHVPREGGALLVVNHVSFVDALLIGAALPRPARFLMYRDFFRIPLVGWFARRMGAIPVSATDDRRSKVKALADAAERARNGDLVCIFAEGSITRSGVMLPFARGLERIARKADVPIVPIGLDRLWGSIFSFEGARVFWKRPQRIPYPVEVSIGAPMPADSPAWQVRSRIQELIAERRSTRSGRRGSLAWRFLRNARVHSSSPAIADGTGVRMSYRKLLVSTLALRRLFGRRLGPAGNVAVLLPPGAAGAMVNIALTLVRKASVNLNYTLSNNDQAECAQRAGVEQVITSRRFLEKLDRPSPLAEQQTLFMEDLVEEIGVMDKLCAFLLALLPGRILARLAPQVSADETATILFSSGSTGQPKGVVLSHGNILSNVQGVLEVISIGPGDGLLGVLPFFHSFGYTVTLWGTLLSGGKAVYHANPLDAGMVAKLSRTEAVSVMVATPTFYRAYLRRCEPADLASVRIALSGAEKLPVMLADAWLEKFGVELMEGYGCTELSPVVSFNVPDVDLLGVRQVGHKAGTIGRPLPGLAVRITDVDTGALLEPGQSGLLEVKGPSVMQGYLEQPEATAEVLRDGWYATGDVAELDRDGFLTITDRLSRFSKLGGEMVPHGRVEDELQTVFSRLTLARAGSVEGMAELAVTARPDPARGERLVVIHTAIEFTVEEVLTELTATTDLPGLFIPRLSEFIAVDAIPKLGTGKTDLKALRELGAR